MQDSAPVYLDLDTWPRRAAFDFFRGFDIPCFNICTRVDVTRLKQAVREGGVGSLSLAYHFIAIRLANEIASFRYRLEGERVRVHAQVHGSTTVLREDDSFGFATLQHQHSFAAFAAQALANAPVEALRRSFQAPPGGAARFHTQDCLWPHRCRR